ncbi:MAG: hypothetical protein NVSMB31_09910 [Vulcanimicrobiaceae bacterium]
MLGSFSSERSDGTRVLGVAPDLRSKGVGALLRRMQISRVLKDAVVVDIAINS